MTHFYESITIQLEFTGNIGYWSSYVLLDLWNIDRMKSWYVKRWQRSRAHLCTRVTATFRARYWNTVQFVGGGMSVFTLCVPLFDRDDNDRIIQIRYDVLINDLNSVRMDVGNSSNLRTYDCESFSNLSNNTCVSWFPISMSLILFLYFLDKTSISTHFCSWMQKLMSKSDSYIRHSVKVYVNDNFIVSNRINMFTISLMYWCALRLCKDGIMQDISSWIIIRFSKSWTCIKYFSCWYDWLNFFFTSNSRSCVGKLILIQDKVCPIVTSFTVYVDATKNTEITQETSTSCKGSKYLCLLRSQSCQCVLFGSHRNRPQTFWICTAISFRDFTWL